MKKLVLLTSLLLGTFATRAASQPSVLGTQVVPGVISGSDGDLIVQSSGPNVAATNAIHVGSSSVNFNRSVNVPSITITNTAPVTITISGGTAATDASVFSSWFNGIYRISATANFTLSNPTNPTDGQRATWIVTQDATGSRLITLGSKFAFGTDITGITLSTTANASDFITAIYNSSADKWRVVGFVRGY